MPLTVVLVVVVVVVSFMAIFGGNFGCLGGSAAAGEPPSAAAVSDIPPAYLRIYQDVGRRFGLDWAFLASIGAQESGHGANAVTSSAGCIGVMQLCGSFTQPPIAVDGNGDGDIQLAGTDDPADSIASAANGIIKLKSHGVPPRTYAQYRQVACDYYGACSDGNANYADEVMARAVQYGFQAAGSPAPSDPATAGDRPAAVDRSLLTVGDSLAMGTAAPLADALAGWRVDTDARTDRTSSEGLTRLEAHASDELPSVLAVSLGTNDSPSATTTFRSNVERVMEIAGTSRCVVWPTITRPPLDGVSYAGLNRVLRSVASTHPNLQIVDDPATGLAGDGVHRTPAGYRARAQLIASAAEQCLINLSPASQQGIGATSGGCGGASSGAAPTVPGDKAMILPTGEAAAPESAPAAVQQMIAAGNRINTFAYSFGGAHGAPDQTMNQQTPNPAAVPGEEENGAPGYDCSSTVSYVLWGGGLGQTLLRGSVYDSSTLETVGDPGPGRWVTIYANAGHAYIEVAGIFMDTAAGKGKPPNPPTTGPRWSQVGTANGEGFVIRHPRGL